VNFSDPSIAIGLLMLGMALGALLTKCVHRRDVRKIVEGTLSEVERDRCATPFTP
jgi:hypothetical protein